MWNTRRVRVGILGCASIARRSVIPAIQGLDKEYKVVAVASRDIEKAKAFAETFECDVAEGYDEIVCRSDIDALYVPLPSGIQYSWIKKALKCNKHIYAEKSLTLNHRDASELVDLAKINGLALMEGFMFRYHPQHTLVRQVLAEGRLGELRQFRAQFGFPPLDSSNFRYDPEIGGGVVADAAGYPVSAAQMFAKGDLRFGSSHITENTGSKCGLYGSATLYDDSGTSYLLGFGFDNSYRCNYDIWGQNGSIYVNHAFTPKRSQRTQVIIETAKEGKRIVDIEPCDQFERAWLEFYKLVNDETHRSCEYNTIWNQSRVLDLIRSAI
jgi:predicted dehydrogenase